MRDFCEVLDTDYGKIVVNKYDTAQTGFYRITRRAIAHSDMEQVLYAVERRYGNAPINIVDAGAHIGSFSLFFRHYLPNLHGAVLIEPLHVYAEMIEETCQLNGIDNFIVMNVALSDYMGQIEVPEFDWSIPSNFGGIELGDAQREFIGQPRLAVTNQVPCIRLDSFAPPSVGIIKIDVEGMESAVLRGSRLTIARDKPILFVEFIKSDVGALQAQIEAMGYTVQRMHTDFLCLPQE